MSANVDGLRAKAIERWTTGFSTAVDETVDRLREQAPVGETGKLRDSIGADPVAFSGSSMRTTIRATAESATWTNDGTTPHIIVPVNAKVLRFEGAGGVVFARSVNHPGNQGSHWWDNTFEPAWRDAIATALA